MTAKHTLNYGHLMQKAMRSMMAEVLGYVAENGLPGAHHFYIGFETDHPGVDIPDWLRESYPTEMTIVLQEWFEDLAVTGDRFTVTLSFSGQPQTLVVPFDAVRTFVDPSVEFGLKFDAQEPDTIDPEMLEEIASRVDQDAEAAEANTPPKDKEKPENSADVVSLDKFRKH